MSLPKTEKTLDVRPFSSRLTRGAFGPVASTQRAQGLAAIIKTDWKAVGGKERKSCNFSENKPEEGEQESRISSPSDAITGCSRERGRDGERGSETLI